MLNSLGSIESFFSDTDAIISFVQSLGPLGPLSYILLQIFQTVVAPIPGNLVGSIGGFLFGWWGVLWTTIGACIGAIIVFWISRKVGRRIIEKFIKKPTLDKFDFLLRGNRAPLLIFLIYLIPGLPDDTVCYIAGLTKVPIKTLVVLFVIGRLPAVVVNNYIGMGLGDGNFTLVFILVAISAVLVLLIYWKQDVIINWLKHRR